MNIKSTITLLAFTAFASTMPLLSQTVPTSSAQIQQWRGLYEGDAKPTTTVFITEQTWAAFWKHLGKAEPGPLKDGEMGVYVSFGEQPNGGYKPYILGAVEGDGKLVVSYSPGKTPTGEFAAQGVSHPWVAAVIPKSKLQVMFKEAGK